MVKQAASPTPATQPACGFQVVSVAKGSSPGTGQYFYFNNEGKSGLSTVMNVKQYRSRSLIWSGQVKRYGNTKYLEEDCTGCNDFGRRNSGTGAGQFQVGDVMHFVNVHPLCSSPAPAPPPA